jgi:predicted PurR-regulated permease PerM
MSTEEPSSFPKWSTRQVVYATLFVLLVLTSFFLLYRFSRIVFILFIAIVLGTAIRPAVEWLYQRGISRSGGVILVYVLLFLLVVGVGVALVPLFTQQAAAIVADIPVYYNDFRTGFIQSPSRILQQIAIQLPADLSLISLESPPGTAENTDMVAQSVNYINVFARSVLTLTAVFVLGFYWTLESDRSIRSMLLFVSSNRRDYIRELIAEIENKVGGFVVGQGLLCFVVGVMALGAYWLIGLPYALVLAVLAGLLEAVPVFGPVLGAIPALLIALSTDPPKAVWVIVAMLVIQGLENFLFVPRIMKRSVGVNPFVTLLALAAFSSLFGLAGALLAIPIAAVLQLLLDRFVLQPDQAQAQTLDGRDRLSLIRYETQDLIQDVRKQLRENETIDGSMEEIVDTLEAIAIDLDQMLARSATQEQNT